MMMMMNGGHFWGPHDTVSTPQGKWELATIAKQCLGHGDLPPLPRKMRRRRTRRTGVKMRRGAGRECMTDDNDDDDDEWRTFFLWDPHDTVRNGDLPPLPN